MPYRLWKMKRIYVSIPNGAWNIIEKELKGKIGGRDSEIIMILFWLIYLKKASENRLDENGKRKRN